ncbi:MAG: hypothetical protein NPIRA02_15750 [Nitrospirales bacterium]|nr:MAG: hypothetical protein NPIRA02_15750 [Nitrospirales bacterium]
MAHGDSNRKSSSQPTPKEKMGWSVDYRVANDAIEKFLHSLGQERTVVE